MDQGLLGLNSFGSEQTQELVAGNQESRPKLVEARLSYNQILACATVNL